MDKPSALVGKNELITEGSIVEQGDIGIILKADGTHRVFSLGMEHLTTADMTQELRDRTRKLLALVAALKTPELMEQLMAGAENPAFVRQDKIVDYGTSN